MLLVPAQLAFETCWPESCTGREEDLEGMIRRKPGYRWVIFGLSFSNMMAEGGITDIVPVIFLALRTNLRWSATATAGIFSMAGFTGAIVAPIAGRLLDRLEPRYVFLIGGLLILIGLFTSSFGSEIWHLLILFGVVMTIGETIVSGFAINAVLVPWFPGARGRVLGLVDVGNPVGTLLLVPLTQLLISTIGWQDTFRILGLIFFLLLVPGNFFFLRRPPENRLPKGRVESPTPNPGPASISPSSEPSRDPPQGTAAPVVATGDERDAGYLTLAEILRYSPALWLLGLGRFLASTGRFVIVVHIVAFFATIGYDPLVGASAIGAVGLVNLAGRPIMGAISDRFGREVALTLAYGVQILAYSAIMVLGDGQRLWPIFMFVALLGLGEGVGGMLMNAKVADVFPNRSLGTVMGIIEGSHKLAFLVGPLLGGLLFDLQGDYQIAFTTALALMGSSLVIFWGVYFATRSSPREPVLEEVRLENAD